MIQAIDSYRDNKLLNTSPSDLTDYFVQKYRIPPIELLEDDITVDVQDEKVDVSQDRLRSIVDRSTPTLVDGTVTKIYVPFEGEADLFKCVPSHRTSVVPWGTVRGNELQYSIPRTDHDAEAIQNEIEDWLSDVQKYVRWIREDLEPWNEQLRERARGRVDGRREKLLKDRKVADSLDFKLRKRDDAPKTYAAPGVERKSPPTPPAASNEPYSPEPALPEEDYEHVLEVIQKAATALERSPETFQDMGEEQLRDQFLVTLNTHYEGQATGETFNRGGKTDILIRSKDKPIFIAECKIWRGPRSLEEALDQILDYSTWRDTKASVLLFNRDRQASTLLKKIPEILENHDHFKRDEGHPSETGFRAILGSKGDPNRELTVTVLVFEVPEPPDG